MGENLALKDDVLKKTKKKCTTNVFFEV